MRSRPNDLSGLDDAYLAAIERFHAWCDGCGLNFRAELTRMIQKRIGAAIDLPIATDDAAKRIGRPRLSDNEQRARQRAYYEANKERVKAYMREWRRRKAKGEVHV